MVDRLPPEVRDFLDAADPAARDAAWERFVATFSRLLLHVARSVFSDPDEAMDAYACCLEHLRANGGRRLATYAGRNNSKFSTWLVVVARRLCLDCRRQKVGHFRAGKPRTAESMEGRKTRQRILKLAGEAGVLDTLRDPALDPAQEAENSERRRLLEQFLEELPSSDRLLLALRFDDGLSASEIARVTGLPSPFHVYRRLDRLLLGLRRRFNGRGLLDSGL